MISPLISLMTPLLFSHILFNLHIFVNFPIFFLWLISSFILFWYLRRHLILFENFWIFLRFVLWTNMYSSWRIFYMPLKRICILLLLNKMFCSFLVAQMVKNLPTMWEAQVWFPGQEDPPGEGNNNPFRYSYLENSMDRGAWQATSPLGCKKLDMAERLTLWYIC